MVTRVARVVDAWRWSPRAWWFVCVLLSTGLLALDYVTGPYIRFPVTFVLPVALLAWNLGPHHASMLAVMLPTLRFVVVRFGFGSPEPLLPSIVDEAIDGLVLVGVGLLVARLAEQSRALRTRVVTLEGLLPICCICKKIRRDDGTWEPIEKYVSARSPTSFSHGFCEACAYERYPEYFDPPSA